MGVIRPIGLADYRRSVEEQLTKIKRNPVGSIIVNGITGGERALFITPYTKADQPNAETIADKTQAAAPKGVSGGYGKDQAGWFRGHLDDPDTIITDERYDKYPVGKGKGTGEGSDVQIGFSVNAGSSTGPGSQPDELLCHELVHALRMTQGKFNPIPTDDKNEYDNEEDFLAVVTTNVYMSANNKLELRADHNDFTVLKPPLNTSDGFLISGKNHNRKSNLELMKIYNLVWQPTFSALSAVPAKFNPFRALKLLLGTSPDAAYSVARKVLSRTWPAGR